MKRGLLTAGEHDGDEAVFIYTLEEIEYLLFCVREAHKTFRHAPGQLGRIMEGALLRTADSMREEARADGANV